jgi:hypothetical protein
MICQKLWPIKFTLLWVFLLNILTRRITLLPATHTSLYTYGTVTSTPQAYARQEEDKPEARAVCRVRDWRLVYREGAERAREDIPSGAATMRILA